MKLKAEQIQCVVSSGPLNIKSQVVDFGQSQQPKLWDYADGVDTMAFLTALNDSISEIIRLGRL